MILRIRSSPYLKPHWMLNFAPSAASAKDPAPTHLQALAQGRSQVDMAYDILKKAHSPFHISEILDRIQSHLRHHRRSREPRLFPYQKSRPWRPLPPPRKKHLLPAPGGPMSLLCGASSPSTPIGAPRFPNSAPFSRAVRQALGSLVCLGRRCLTRIIWTNGGQHRSWSAEYFLHSRCHWSRRSCSGRFSNALWSIVRNAWSAWPSTIPSCARPAARSPRRSISAIRCPRLFMSTSCWACVSCRLPCWCRCIAVLRWARRAMPIRFQEVSRVKSPRQASPEAEGI